jgi:hypothetical protein
MPTGDEPSGAVVVGRYLFPDDMPEAVAKAESLTQGDGSDKPRPKAKRIKRIEDLPREEWPAVWERVAEIQEQALRDGRHGPIEEWETVCAHCRQFIKGGLHSRHLQKRDEYCFECSWRYTGCTCPRCERARAEDAEQRRQAEERMMGDGT